MPLAQILHQQLLGIQCVYCLLTFLKRLGPVSYFFLQFAYRLLYRILSVADLWRPISCAPVIVERLGASDSNANGNMALAVTADRKDGNMCDALLGESALLLTPSASALPSFSLPRLGGDSGGDVIVAFLFLS